MQGNALYKAGALNDAYACYSAGIQAMEALQQQSGDAVSDVFHAFHEPKMLPVDPLYAVFQRDCRVDLLAACEGLASTACELIREGAALYRDKPLSTLRVTESLRPRPYRPNFD